MPGSWAAVEMLLGCGGKAPGLNWKCLGCSGNGSLSQNWNPVPIMGNDIRGREKLFQVSKFCNLGLEATDFSLINYSREKDLNNLGATRNTRKIQTPYIIEFQRKLCFLATLNVKALNNSKSQLFTILCLKY